MDLAKKFAERRGISASTLKRMGVTAGIAPFEKPSQSKKREFEDRPAIKFQYYDPETMDVIGWKARSLVDPKRFTQGKGSKQAPYNWHNVVVDPPERLVIVEGEMDAIALVEAGWPINEVVSPPNGAPDLPDDGKERRSPWEMKKYAWVIENLDEIKRVKEYILATDSDEPGRLLRHDLVSILGKAKCRFIDWPDGTKDANEYLLSFGRGALVSAVESAKLWPVKGIYTLAEVPEAPQLEVWSPGWPEAEGKIMLGRGMLSVTTGYPNHGKSVLMTQVWTAIAKREQFPVAVFGPETGIKPHTRTHIRQFWAGRLERDMTPRDIAEADDFIEHAFRFIDPGDDEDPTVDWLLDRIETVVHRHQCRAVMVDPWNYLEEDFDAREETETRWIGRSLKKFRQAARGLNIHIGIVAHPAKPPPDARKTAPDLYAISGSAHWNNRVDQGFVVHRPVVWEDGQRKTEAELHCRKAKYAALGYPSVVKLDYDLSTGVYRCTDYDGPSGRGIS